MEQHDELTPKSTSRYPENPARRKTNNSRTGLKVRPDKVQATKVKV